MPHFKCLLWNFHGEKLFGIQSGFWKESGTYVGSLRGCLVECLIFCEILLLPEGMNKKVEWTNQHLDGRFHWQQGIKDLLL